MRLLLESGVNPDVANEDGLTALHQVSEHKKNIILYKATIFTLQPIPQKSLVKPSEH